nr:FAD-dependent oxidoreductase [Rhizobium mongolense]
MAEIVVLGAGMVGVFTALALQADGHGVTIVDRTSRGARPVSPQSQRGRRRLHAAGASDLDGRGAGEARCPGRYPPARTRTAVAWQTAQSWPARAGGAVVRDAALPARHAADGGGRATA